MGIVWDASDEAFTYTHPGGTPASVTTISIPATVGGRVEVMIEGSNKILSLAEVEVFGTLIGTYEPTIAPTASPTVTPKPNIARGKPTTQSRTSHGGVSSRAVDGNTNGNWNNRSVTHTPRMSNPSWSVDLRGKYRIDEIKVYNRQDCCTYRLSGFKVIVWDASDEAFTYTHAGGTPARVTTISVPPTVGGRVEVKLEGNNKILSLAEVEVFGTLIGTYAPTIAPTAVPTTTPKPNIARGKPTKQSRTSYGGVSSRAVDGNTNGNWRNRSVTHTPNMSNR